MKENPKVIVVAETENHWYIVCPHCKEIHAHSKEYGHRISHCTNRNNGDGYNIVKTIG